MDEDMDLLGPNPTLDAASSSAKDKESQGARKDANIHQDTTRDTNIQQDTTAATEGNSTEKVIPRITKKKRNRRARGKGQKYTIIFKNFKNMTVNYT